MFVTSLSENILSINEKGPNFEKIMIPLFFYENFQKDMSNSTKSFPKDFSAI